MQMIKGNRTKEVLDNKLISLYEKDGWVKADAPKEEVKATLKPAKRFTEVQEEDSETVEVTPTDNEEASN